jgi:tetratricopeptide (TPR) repeat protein
MRYSSTVAKEGVLPPQPSERWPASVRDAFAEMSRLLEQGEWATVTEWCERVLGLLRDMETNAPDLRTQRQIAYSYFDLTSAYEQLGRLEDTRRSYEQSRDRWAAIAGSLPADFEAQTQLAACHNHLGLLARGARRWADAEAAFQAALAIRQTASEAHPNHPEQPDNLVYLSGVLCNLGYLYLERGDRDQAIRYFDQAIRFLNAVLPPPHEPQEQAICDLWKDAWTRIYGLPHWARVAQQFLANAQNGKAKATEGDSA